MLGSIINGTMLPEDLIPAFIEELRYRMEDSAHDEDIAQFIDEVSKRMEIDGYFESDDAHYDLDSLFDRLNEVAPPYAYFGAHPGDGAAYGFWLIDDLEDRVLEDDGLVVSDIDEVPEDFEGFVLQASDYGTSTLYQFRAGGDFEIVWSCG